MKRIFRRLFPATPATFVALVLVATAFALVANEKKATEAREMEKALQRYLELTSDPAPDVREERLTAAYIPDKRVEELHRDIHRDLLKVATEEHAKWRLEETMVGLKVPGPAEFQRKCKYRFIEIGAEVLAIYDIEFTGLDTANILAIVWSGARLGQFDPATNRTTLVSEGGNTIVSRYPMRLIDGKWKVAGSPGTVKGCLIGGDGTFSPPYNVDPEEVRRVWEAEGYTWDEKARRYMPDDTGGW